MASEKNKNTEKPKEVVLDSVIKESITLINTLNYNVAFKLNNGMRINIPANGSASKLDINLVNINELPLGINFTKN